MDSYVFQKGGFDCSTSSLVGYLADLLWQQQVASDHWSLSGLVYAMPILLMQLPITYFINVDFSNSMSMRESHRQYSLRYCNRSFVYKRYKDFVMFVLVLKINSLYSENLGNSLGWQWTWTGQMETPAIFTLDTLTMGKKGRGRVGVKFLTSSLRKWRRSFEPTSGAQLNMKRPCQFSLLSM